MAVHAAWKPEFKSYLRVEIVRGTPGAPPRLSLHFGHTDGVLVSDGPYERKLFSLLDGSRTCQEIIREMKSDPHITTVRVWGDLKKMFEFGLLQNAAADKAGLSQKHIKRLERHIGYLGLLDTPGEKRYHLQRKLLESHVTVLGTGAMGSHVLDLLGRIGVGNFRIVDDDTVEVSNLNRGRFTRADIGKAKTQVVRELLLGIDDAITIEVQEKRINSAQDIVDILQTGRKTDLVLLCADTPLAISSWMNQAALQTGIPFLTSGYQGCGAEVGPLVIPGKTDCLMCLLGRDAPDSEDVSHVEVPQELVWLNERAATGHPTDAAHTAFVASRLAHEAEMYLIGQTPNTLGTILNYDPATWSFGSLERPRVRNCPACGRRHPDETPE
ncbi:MAG: ThiF family adenylyltransferase [Ktedonobacteraceae bacterium]|nr:ThiF family adenylyltransferase [Ktedonobacteraceae bacterium]